jgi:hypothetical protein
MSDVVVQRELADSTKVSHDEEELKLAESGQISDRSSDFYIMTILTDGTRFCMYIFYDATRTVVCLWAFCIPSMFGATRDERLLSTN